jgi:hypothetical protein
MKKVPVVIAFALFLLSCGDSSVNISGVDNSGNSSSDDCYYYGYCDDYYSSSRLSSSGTLWQSSSSLRSSSSVTPLQTANAVILTLTYWNSTDTDVGGLDPKIYFTVTAFQNRSRVSNNNSNVLLDAQDISVPWTGSAKSSPIPFVSQADSLVIKAVVIEKDLLSDDDISPGYYTYWKQIPYAGHSGSTTLDYGYGKSMVKFNFEFIRQ